MRYILISILTLLAACTVKNQQADNAQTGTDSVLVTTDSVQTAPPTVVEETPATPAAGFSYQAGIYSNKVKVALDRTYLTGVYQNGYFEGEQKYGCSFYFYSDLSKTGEDVKPVFMVLPVKTNKIYEGEISMKDAGLNIKMKAFNGDYCYDPSLGWSLEDATFELKEEKKWTAWGIANTEKVYFYAEPKDALKLKTYVIKGDALLINTWQEGWYEVEYVGANNSTTKGWVKTSEVFMPFEEQIFSPML